MRLEEKRQHCKLALLLVICLVITGLLTGCKSPVGSPATASASLEATIANEGISAITTTTNATAKKSNVYDADDNKLMYNRVTGMVFSSKGVVYTNDSQPLTYNDEIEEFSDSLKRRLDLVEKSTSDLQNYYLMFGSYKVRSIGIDDELYIGRIKAKTAFNSGTAYEMLITRVWVSYPWWKVVISGFRTGHYEYYDLKGHEIDIKYFDVDTKINIVAGAGTSWSGGFVSFDKWGTIKDLLEEIVLLMELVPPSGVMGKFALNTVTGAFLRDDRAQKIRIAENGQLIDPMSWPLIGADARPVYWNENLYAYVDYKGQLLDFSENNSLHDSSGFVVHSVISNVIAGQRIYLIYLVDEITLIPATLKTISTNPYKAEYYDMNGSKIEPSEIVEPEISVDDRKENWPEEFESFWEQVQSFFASISEFFASVGAFLKQWGVLILIGILVLITSPITLPILLMLLGFIFRRIIALITLPFRLIKKSERG